ncbi:MULTISPECIES: hypothetical protein [unclassified Streptomyces]|uniref:hypothetical protein n=1 Tax=unclassified Streptomyces TaxID=2593676 RepID=UPI00114CA70C|nr:MULTISPECIES: hypothetical protein [unclassified Streptomyces]MYR29808.1 hypothetical protein [Streptomyces sp. SID4945]
MSAPPPVMPDVEAAAVAVLTGALPGAWVGTEWPARLAERLPVVAPALGGGGSRLRGITADRTLDIDILAGTKGAARTLAAAAAAALIAARGATVGGLHFYDVDETSLIWLPYQPSAETDPIPRYVLVMSAVVRPA